MLTMSDWKWLVLALGAVGVCAAAVIILRSVQRNRDLAETLLWMDQTYNPHDGGDNLGQGHGWEIHYLRKGQTGALWVPHCDYFASPNFPWAASGQEIGGWRSGDVFHRQRF